MAADAIATTTSPLVIAAARTILHSCHNTETSTRSNRFSLIGTVRHGDKAHGPQARKKKMTTTPTGTTGNRTRRGGPRTANSGDVTPGDHQMHFRVQPPSRRTRATETSVNRRAVHASYTSFPRKSATTTMSSGGAENAGPDTTPTAARPAGTAGDPGSTHHAPTQHNRRPPPICMSHSREGPNPIKHATHQHNHSTTQQATRNKSSQYSRKGKRYGRTETRCRKSQGIRHLAILHLLFKALGNK